MLNLTLPDATSISKKHIGNGFWKINRATCKANNWPVPKIGYYIPVVFDGHRCEIHWTIERDKNLENPKHVLAIMTTSHKA